jgi:predicted PurR-regulated permease PerM
MNLTKNTDLDISLLLKPVVTWLSKYHFLLLFVVLSAVVIYVSYSVSQMLTQTTDNTYQSQVSTETNITFDKATIKQLQSLKTSDNNSVLTIPGRIRKSPFVE